MNWNACTCADKTLARNLGYAANDAVRSGLSGIVGEVGVAGGGLDLGVPEQLADHGQAFAYQETAAGEGVSVLVLGLAAVGCLRALVDDDDGCGGLIFYEPAEQHEVVVAAAGQGLEGAVVLVGDVRGRGRTPLRRRGGTGLWPLRSPGGCRARPPAGWSRAGGDRCEAVGLRPSVAPTGGKPRRGGARCRRDTGEACGTRAPVSVSWGVWVGGRAHGSPRSAGGPGKGRVQGDRREDRRHVQSEGCGSHRSDDDAPGGLRVEPTASSRRVGRPRQDGGPAGICVNPIGEQQSCLAVGFAVLQDRRDKGALPGLELLAAAVDGCLGERRRGQLLGIGVVESDLDALGDALDLFNDGVG